MNGELLLKAIQENPADDHVRLIYADWLDECGPERVACKKCDGTGWKYSGPTGQPKCPDCQNSSQNKTPHGSQSRLRCASCKLVWTPPKCHPCQGTGTTLDTSRQDRAELIRVQIELKNIREWPVNNRHKSLLLRESTLVESHPEWFPVCPNCDGYRFKSPHASCPYCSKGRMGLLTRGLIETLVIPTRETVLVQCQTCFDERETLHQCRDCGNAGYVLSEWGASLVRDRERWPALREVRIWNVVPHASYHTNGDYIIFEGNNIIPHSVPRIVFDELEGPPIPENNRPNSHKKFPSLELAHAALGRAMWRVMLRLAEGKQ